MRPATLVLWDALRERGFAPQPCAEFERWPNLAEMGAGDGCVSASGNGYGYTVGDGYATGGDEGGLGCTSGDGWSDIGGGGYGSGSGDGYGFEDGNSYS